MDNIQIIAVREHPEYLERAVDYTSSKWNVSRSYFEDCFKNSMTTESPLPKFYLMIKDNEIIGSYGLIINDNISRQDLYPWFCTLFIEEDERGKALGSQLLEHGRRETAAMGYPILYLWTEHVGLYEKYGWSFIGIGYTPKGEEKRIYKAETIT